MGFLLFIVSMIRDMLSLNKYLKVWLHTMIDPIKVSVWYVTSSTVARQHPHSLLLAICQEF
jgi:hypothetical protein